MPSVTPDKAMCHSAVWARVRLRADLISTLPLDVYRRENGIQEVGDHLQLAAKGVDVVGYDAA
jgi:hypothetical protein